MAIVKQYGILIEGSLAEQRDVVVSGSLIRRSDSEELVVARRELLLQNRAAAQGLGARLEPS